jgi:hypothetical protein
MAKGREGHGQEGQDDANQPVLNRFVDSSFHLTQRRKIARLNCWKSEPSALSLRLCVFA